MKVRYGILAFAAFGALLAGCPSGPLGERPVAEFGKPAADGPGDRITIHFSVSDDDMSITDVTAEYSVDDGRWRPATLVSSSAGVAGKGTVSALPGARGGIACGVVWKSWADDVGKTDGGQSVRLRITPYDSVRVG